MSFTACLSAVGRCGVRAAVLWLFLVVLVPGALAQNFTALAPAFKSRALQEAINRRNPNNPLRPRPFPSPAGQPLPEGANGQQEFEILRAGRTSIRKRVVYLDEGCEFLLRGYRIIGSTAEGNLDTEVFTVKGGVQIIGEDTVVTGEVIVIDFKNGTFNATNGTAVISPNLTNGQTQGDTYVKGRLAYGSDRRIDAKDCQVTGCNLQRPHFHFDARSTEVIPDRHILMKDVGLTVLDKEILRLPFLWIPLGDRSYNYLPAVGQTPDEGFYVKNRYGFPMRGEDIGVVRLDYMERIGEGAGLEYYYRNPNLNGIAKFYTVQGRQGNDTTTLNLQHEQRFGLGTLTVDHDRQQNNYLTAPGSTITNTRALFQLAPGGTANTSLGFVQNTSTNDFSANTNESISLNDSRTFGKFQTTTAITYAKASNRFQSGSTTNESRRETVDVRLQGRQDFERFTAGLEYQRTVPIGQIENFFPGSDRTPVFTFSSDSKRLLGESAPKNWPFRTEMTSGEYFDPQQRRRFTRHGLDFNFNRSTKDRGNWRWDFNGRYRQGFTNDDTAQYTLNMGTALTYDINRTTTVNLRYTYLRPYGYSPLIIDRVGNTNLVTLDALNKFGNAQVGLQTGYDIARLDRSEIPWQQVGVRAEYQLQKAFSLRTLTTYDTFRQIWSNARVDLAWNWDTASAAIGARYDGVRHTWSNVNLFLDGLEYGRTRLGAILSFNGFSGRFDSQQYNLIYDLHCAEAVLTVSDFGTGFRSGREITFLIRIKAFPFDTNFGFGRQGQPLGTGTGRDF